MEEKIKDLKFRINDLMEQLKFKNQLLNEHYNLFVEIYKLNYNKVNEMIEKEFWDIKEDISN